MKPRLLIVGPLPPPIGGVETVTQAILEAPAFKTFDVHHVDITKGRPKQTQGRFDLGNFYWAMRHFARMRSAVARFRPDAVYMPVASSWSGFLRDGVLAKIAKASGAKVIGHVHGGRFDQILNYNGLAARRVRRALSHFDVLLALGTRWLELIRDSGFRGRVYVVPSTLKQDFFDRASALSSLPRQEADATALFVGQVGRRKGIFDLLAALRGAIDLGARIRLVVVGPSEYPKELEEAKRLTDALSLRDVVRFTGPLMNECLLKEFAAADFLVMPSYAEGLPVVFFEAGAFGMPVVTTPVGAIPDLIESGRNGMLVNPGDVEGIRDALMMMAGDSEARRKMGRQLNEDIQRFHPHAVSQRIAAILEENLAVR